METRGNLEKASEGKVHILTRSATIVHGLFCSRGGFYSPSAYAGGMSQQSFQGIRRGSKVLPGTGAIKECPYVEI